MDSSYRFELTAQPALPAQRRILAAIVMVLIGAMIGGTVAQMRGLSELLGWVLGMLAGGAWFAYRWREYGGGYGPPPILVTPKGISLPRGRDVVSVPWDEVLACFLVKVGEVPMIQVVTVEQSWGFAVGRFKEPDGAALLHQVIRGQLSPEQIARGAAQLQREVAFAQQGNLWTRYSVYAVIAVFIMQELLSSEPLVLLLLGANAPSLVWAGQWDRLFMANMLHAGVVHIAFNLMAIHFLGTVLERLRGGPFVLAMLVITGVAGQLTSAWIAKGLLSVGASAAAFGLLGALAWYNAFDRGALPGSARFSKRWWAFILGTNLALPLLIPQIDGGAHLGGFVVGFVLAPLFDRARPLVNLAAAASLILMLLSAGITAKRFQEPRYQLYMDFLGVLMGHADEQPANDLNNFAWVLLTDPETPAAGRALALEAAQKAVDSEPDQAAFRDTLATARYQHGHFEAAVEQGVEALKLTLADTRMASKKNFMATQLLRFLTDGGYETSRAVVITPGQNGALHFDATAAGAFTAYVEVNDGTAAVGLLRLTSATSMGSVETPHSWPPNVRFIPRLMREAGVDAAEPKALFFPLDPEVGQMPGYRATQG